MAFEPRPGGPVPGCPCMWCMLTRSLDRFTERLAAEDAMKDTQPSEREQAMSDELNTLRKENVELKRSMEFMQLDRNGLIKQLDIARGQWAPDTRTVRRCAAVLATFYRSTLSMSSVQPLLALAEELNPSLKESK